MVLAICILTVLTVDWYTDQTTSIPIRVPCEGFDHITRLEIITTATTADYHELESVLGGQMKFYERPENNDVYSEPKIGPKHLGNHYADMFEEAKYVLSQRDNVRLISITERVAHDNYGGVDHLYNRLMISSYDISEDKSVEMLNKTFPDGRTTSMVTISDVVEDPTQDHRDGTMIVEPDVVKPRQRRAGNLEINSEIKTHVENKNQDSDSSTSDVKTTTNGGGYGSHTCLNVDTDVWSNSTVTNGHCRCECPPCKTDTVLGLVKDANAERTAAQSKLEQCQTQLYQSFKGQRSRSSTSRGCSVTEIKRLKEETRSLRARMRRMVPTVPPAASPAPLPSSLTTSLETIGGSLASGVASYVSGNVSRGPTVSKVPAMSSPSATSSSASVMGSSTTVKSPSRSSIMKPAKNMASQPSKFPPTKVKNQSRYTRPRRSRKPRKFQRGRRSSGRFDDQKFARDSELWIRLIREMQGGHFSNSEFQIGKSTTFTPTQPLHMVQSTDEMYNTTTKSRPRHFLHPRRRRDLQQSHFSGSTNSVMENASFHGSSEHHVDKSQNVRVFRPVVSPKVRVTTPGKNETHVQKSHNGNDIKIVTANPCECDDDLTATMWAIWMQLILSIMMVAGLLTYLHLRRNTSFFQKRETALLKLQAQQLKQSASMEKRLTNRISEETKVVSDLQAGGALRTCAIDV